MLTQRQLQIVAMLAEGKSQQEIADALKLNIRTIERAISRSEIRQAVAEAQSRTIAALGDALAEQCRAALIKALPKSIKRIIEALDHEDARLRLKAAELVCKISGFYQPSANTNLDQTRAEADFKLYINSLQTNGNGRGATEGY